MNTFLDLMQPVEGAELERLEPMTTLLVWTRNSLYRIVVVEGSDVLVQGGSFFQEATPARVGGASGGGTAVMSGWIRPGQLLEFSVNGKRVVTSPVFAIVIRRPDTSVVQ